MKDCKGNELKIGDEVVFVKGKNSDASLDTGKITKFYIGYFDKEECSVGKHSHIRSNRVMKLSSD